jgi:hypothetical protein
VCGIPIRPSQAGAATCDAPSCRRLHAIRSPRSERRCLYCSRPAVAPQDTCADPRCRQLRTSHGDARQAEAERREQIERTLRRHEEELRSRPGRSLPEQLLLARLPANEQTVAPLPEERRAAFATNLGAAIDRALDDPDRPVPESPESPADQTAAIRAACAACRGSCCTGGGEHAYLYPDHFRRFLRAHAGRSREEILREYLSRVPDATYHDSCVYHTDAGCALPRDLRSNLCNTFLCGDLEGLLETRARDPRPVLACCIRSAKADVVRSVVLDPPVTAPESGRK